MHHSLLSIFRIAFDEKTKRERECGARAASLTISRAVYEDDSRRHERRERSENDAAIIRNKDAGQRRLRGNTTPRRGCKLREGIPRTATLPRFARGETQEEEEDRAPQWPRERRASAN